jgi:uncharacterized protein DUF5985
MEALRVALYSLALLTSLACAVLLVRGYRRRPYPFLLWSAACFAFLTLNNMILVIDLVLLPNVDLRLWRLLAALAGVACMLYGFIWEAE